MKAFNRLLMRAILTSNPWLSESSMAITCGLFVVLTIVNPDSTITGSNHFRPMPVKWIILVLMSVKVLLAISSKLCRGRSLRYHNQLRFAAATVGLVIWFWFAITYQIVDQFDRLGICFVIVAIFASLRIIAMAAEGIIMDGGYPDAVK